MPETAVIHCADGTPLGVRFNEDGWQNFPFTFNGEHWTYPASAMDIWLDPITPQRAQRAFDEVGLTFVVRTQFAGAFQYVALPDPTPEEIGGMMAAVGKLFTEYRSPLGFWQEFCEPRARRAVASLEGGLREAPMDEVAAEFAYGLAQTFTSITPVMLAVMPLRALLEQHFGPEGAMLADEATQGGANASQAVDAQLVALAELARSIPSALRILSAETNGARLSALRAEPAAKAFVASFDALLAEHSGRSFGWELTLPTWGEDPEAVLTMVAAHARASGSVGVAVSSDDIRNAARARINAALPEAERNQANYFLGVLDGLITIREDRAYWQMRLTGAMRLLLLERGAALVAAGRLERADHIFHLYPQEFEGTGTADLKGLAGSRLAEWERLKQVTPPATFGPPSMLGTTPGSESPRELRGAGVSRGLVTGRARVVHSPDDYDRFEDGDILICRLTTPAWTPMFGLAAAVVTETGGAFSHPAITAREYGIPAVLSVVNATSLIADGSTITVDGAAGTVTLAGD